MKNFKVLILLSLTSISLSSCGNWNIRTGSSNIEVTENGDIFDNQTRDIISKEFNSEGILQECTLGKSSRKRNLPSCNEIRNNNKKAKKIKEKYNRKIAKENKSKINKIFKRNITGNNSLSYSNNVNLKIKSIAKFNAETSILIINTIIERGIDTSSDDFKELFIEDGRFIQISFVDKKGFELMTPLKLPLNIIEGQKQNIIYRKKSGDNIENFVGMRLMARKPISNIIELSKVQKLQISIR